jgi:hypothetical protein
MPSSLRLEPMRFATGNAVEMVAGSAIPGTTVTVVNGSGQPLVRGTLAGQRLSFSVVQRLWLLGGGSAGVSPPDAPSHPLGSNPNQPASPRGRKKWLKQPMVGLARCWSIHAEGSQVRAVAEAAAAETDGQPGKRRGRRGRKAAEKSSEPAPAKAAPATTGACPALLVWP